MMVYLLELVGLDPAGALTTLRYAAGRGYINEAQQVYEGRLVSPGSYERHLWQPGTTAGVGATTTGTLDLANADGALDGWLNWSFDGQAFVVLWGDDGGPRTGFRPVLAGTVQSLAMTTALARLNIADRASALLARPLTGATYGGTNVLPAGIDGTPADIQGQYRPLLWGEVENLPAVRVNTSALIYEISKTAISAIAGVYDGGNAITAGTNRGTVATLQASTPTAATYDYALGSTKEGAYIRLGSTPTYDVTVYAREGAAAANRTIGQIVGRILLSVGVAASDLARLANFDSRQPGVVGYWSGPDGATIGDAVNALCMSGGATLVMARDGSFDILRLEEPATAPAAALTESHLLAGAGGDAIAVLPVNDGVPAYSVDLSWQFNPRVMAAGQTAAAVTTAREDWLAKPYRHQVVSDSTVWNPDTQLGRHPLSKPISIVTQLRAQADAAAEAARQLPLFSRQRAYLSVYVPASVLLGVELGATVTLTTSRFGNAGGSLFLVTGMIEDHTTGITELFLWR